MTYAAVDVEVRVGSTVLLTGVFLELRPGEIVAVAGPNGAGKSTLVATLAGDRRAQGGSVTLAGRALADWPRLDLARRRAVMSADRAVAFAFTAEEVALLGRLPLHGGAPTDVDRAIVRELLEAADCAHLGGRVFATLSTGERQRVALARAIAQVSEDPDVASAERAASPGEARYLLLDEPTSSLDPAHQHLAMGLLRRRADAGLSVLAVLHDLNLAAAYADRVVLMAASRIVAAGPPADVLRPDLLEHVFGIPMLVLPHPHHRHPLVIAEPPLAGE
jgi:iron complex transport system ATP-binding protein